jgi:hypothetical protein
MGAETIAQVMGAIVAEGGTQREVARRGGVSQTWIHDCLANHQPTRKKAVQFADRYPLEGALRARWFAACGMVDASSPAPVAASPDEWSEVPTPPGFEGWEEIPEADRERIAEVVRLMIDQARRRRGAD